MSCCGAILLAADGLANRFKRRDSGHRHLQRERLDTVERALGARGTCAARVGASAVPLPEHQEQAVSVG